MSRQTTQQPEPPKTPAHPKGIAGVKVIDSPQKPPLAARTTELSKSQITAINNQVFDYMINKFKLLLHGLLLNQSGTHARFDGNTKTYVCVYDFNKKGRDALSHMIVQIIIEVVSAAEQKRPVSELSVGARNYNSYYFPQFVKDLVDCAADQNLGTGWNMGGEVRNSAIKDYPLYLDLMLIKGKVEQKQESLYRDEIQGVNVLREQLENVRKELEDTDGRLQNANMELTKVNQAKQAVVEEINELGDKYASVVAEKKAADEAAARNKAALDAAKADVIKKNAMVRNLAGKLSAANTEIKAQASDAGSQVSRAEQQGMFELARRVTLRDNPSTGLLKDFLLNFINQEQLRFMSVLAKHLEIMADQQTKTFSMRHKKSSKLAKIEFAALKVQDAILLQNYSIHQAYQNLRQDDEVVNCINAVEVRGEPDKLLYKQAYDFYQQLDRDLNRSFSFLDAGEVVEGVDRVQQAVDALFDGIGFEEAKGKSENLVDKVGQLITQNAMHAHILFPTNGAIQWLKRIKNLIDAKLKVLKENQRPAGMSAR